MAISCLRWQHVVRESCGMHFILKISAPLDLRRKHGLCLIPSPGMVVLVNAVNVVVLHIWFSAKVQDK
jgi:hypothetical protein